MKRWRRRKGKRQKWKWMSDGGREGKTEHERKRAKLALKLVERKYYGSILAEKPYLFTNSHRIPSQSGEQHRGPSRAPFKSQDQFLGAGNG